MAIIKNGRINIWNTVKKQIETVHPETETARITDFADGIVQKLALTSAMTAVTALQTDSWFVDCRIGSLEICFSRCRWIQHVDCRIGSLEMLNSLYCMCARVDCRIGSLEKREESPRRVDCVDCRIGSLEMYN